MVIGNMERLLLQKTRRDAGHGFLARDGIGENRRINTLALIYRIGGVVFLGVASYKLGVVS